MGSSGRTGRRRRTVAGAVLFFALGGAVVLLAGCAGPAPAHRSPSRPSATSAAPTTAIVTFTAYDAAGHLPASVSSRRDGRCFSPSIAAAGSAALRCMAANQILDPCFTDPASPRTVACFTAPWTSAEVLHLTAAPPAAPRGDVRAWAFETSGGTRCVASTGTVAEIGRTPLPFHCADGTDAALGPLSARPVVARVGAPGASVLRPATVSRVWRV